MASEYGDTERAIYIIIQVIMDDLNLMDYVDDLTECGCSKCEARLDRIEEFRKALNYLKAVVFTPPTKYIGVSDAELIESFKQGRKFLVQGNNLVN